MVKVRLGVVIVGSAALAASTSVSAQVTKTVNFEERPGPQTLTSDGADVTVQARDEGDEMISMAAAIRVPGYQPLIVEDEVISRAGYERWVAIGKLSTADPAPSILLAAFTGGAHCCAALRAVVPTAGKLKVVDFPPIDGAPDEQFPRDLDGDGVVDFARQDDSFRYQFASGAGSYSPPVFYNIHKGQLIDVSDQPGFRRHWESFATQTRKACADQKNDDRNGGCAAFVAASARLGRYEQGLKEAERLANSKPPMGFPEGCSVTAGEDGCPADKKITFYTFSSAIRWFLKSQGYID